MGCVAPEKKKIYIYIKINNNYNNCKKEHILMQVGFKHDITCVQSQCATL